MDVDACFGSLLCWEVKFLYNFSFLMEALRICANVDNDLEVFIHPSTLPKTCFSWKKKKPVIAWGCHHHCPVFFGWCAVSFLCQTYVLERWPKISTFISWDYNIFFHMLLRETYFSTCFWETLCMFLQISVFCLASLLPSPNMKNMGHYFHT